MNSLLKVPSSVDEMNSLIKKKLCKSHLLYVNKNDISPSLSELIQFILG